MVDYHRHALPFSMLLPELVVEVPRAKYQKLTWVVHVTSLGHAAYCITYHSETKSKHLTTICIFLCGPKIYFKLEVYFLGRVPVFLGGDNLFERTWLSLIPAALNLNLLCRYNAARPPL